MKKRTFAVDIDGTITENGGGRIHLDALDALRRLTVMGHDVIFVTGRSSVEAFLLSIFGGTTKIASRNASTDDLPVTNITSCPMTVRRLNASRASK